MNTRRRCWLLTSLFLVGLTCACVFLTTDRFVTKWQDFSPRQTADRKESSERRTTTPERSPESAGEPPKTRDPEPMDAVNPLKGYVGVPDESKQLNLSCGACALVTGSGRMLNYKAGNEIDQADCVIRMNEGPVVGYEKHVGSKTTLRVIAHPSILYVALDAAILEGNYKVLVWGPSKEMDAKTGKTYPKVTSLQDRHPNLQVYKLTEDKIRYGDRVFEAETGLPREKSGTWLSTGWWTVLVAMEICDVIKVYGMIPEGYCRNHPDDQTFYHYFTGRRYRMEDYKECAYQNEQQDFRGGSHKYLTEKAIFARWAPLNNITFINPSWDL
ncbi:PREDICTED: alpha-N-acetyl-neuraminyl-2,3-beta-galactosyl-1,3-N-acetyl-galactosaminide alpha-2,6-sialyltransferase-like [Branchiostoma belcheri]|uniref:Alpha-N-acetyl-neuraminyl-2,3-beta-galactosyl-1, 3-N-acetyl-galactosaminide alpha-2,6-sialyltransferase-like n=1 Tax=Branchiostoma belcheri TaxID=7741 RepID=A0A6P4ZSR9_BRABE|nr:PREDICTED: alpha-N-acetyl-neuraminyl-2,3-beta-galactosyl-1,3-N-acetyl-galactosaminide alpha-2,6-sialyltransferase-like [Branchiostoma belcheri]